MTLSIHTADASIALGAVAAIGMIPVILILSVVVRAARCEARSATDAMRCAACGYPLFGLPEPRCPECGTDFDLPPGPQRFDERPSDSPEP